MELVINIDADGGVQAMHQDTFPLSFLGDMEVKRASELQFNIATQRWDILVPPQTEQVPVEYWGTHPLAQGFPSYEAARQVEVRWFNQCRELAVYPLSDEGVALLPAILADFGY